jgi:hypothetical protein
MVIYYGRRRTTERQSKDALSLLTLASSTSTSSRSRIRCIGQLLLLCRLDNVHGHTHPYTELGILDTLFDTLGGIRVGRG